jgi:hypothetical protein
MTELCKFYLWLLHAKAIAEKAGDCFLSFLTSSLTFEMPIPDGSPKRPWYLFFGTLKKYFLLYGRFQGSYAIYFVY